MHPIKKILIGLGIFPGNMGSSETEEFPDNNVFSHQYRDPDVLKPYLISLGYKAPKTGSDKASFRIHVEGDKIKVYLPNQKVLTKAQREAVYKLFEESRARKQKEARNKRKNAKQLNNKTVADKGRTQESKNAQQKQS